MKEKSELNKVEIIKNQNKTVIKINDQEINFVGRYSITQDIDIRNGIPMLKIKMAIDEKISNITI